jgi:ComF family protein
MLSPACPARSQPCVTCGRPLAVAAAPRGYRCGACRRAPPPFERLVAVWSYQPPLSKVLLALKLRRLDYLAEGLAAAALERLQARDELAELATVEVVIPVPLHWRRRWWRGFNQAEAIARPLAKALGVRHCDALRRRRSGPSQRSLGRGGRLVGPAGSFGQRPGASLSGRRVLLVDDVVTTGATLAAATEALRRAGAREVIALALARTPEPGAKGSESGM